MSNTNDEMQDIAKALNDASENGVQVEVIYAAMIYLKNNSNASISDAIKAGYYEVNNH